MEGTESGILAHTITGAFTKVLINGREASESYLYSLVVGFHGIPVILVVGDAQICYEAKSTIPEIDTVITKVGIIRFSAKSKTLSYIKKELEEETLIALKN